MAKTRYHFYLKDTNSCNPTPINFVFNKGTFRKKKAIGESILPELWDSELELAIEDNRQKKNEKALTKRVNKKLKHLRVDLDDLFDEYTAIDKLTPNHTDGENLLTELYNKACLIIDGAIEEEQEEARKSMIRPAEFFGEFIDKWGRTPNLRTGTVPQENTIWNYKNTLRRYKDYLNDNNIQDSFKLFDEDFQQKFDDYLLNEQELVMNTIVATHSQLKTMLRAAYDKGYLKNRAFLSWVSKSQQLPPIYLTDNELKLIYDLNLTRKIKKENHIDDKSHIEESKDLFIIASRTGLRYGDMTRLGMADWDIQEKMIKMSNQKTHRVIHIPLHEEVIAIYNKYNGKLPKIVDKSRYNEHIRMCAKLAGIDKMTPTFYWNKGRLFPTAKPKYELISSHTARRSFATNLFIACKSSSLCMAVTGHTTEANFKRYIGIDQKEMAMMLKKYINLNPQETNDEFDKFLNAIRRDAVTIEDQKRDIDKLQKEKSTDRLSLSIGKQQEDILKDKIAEMETIWKAYGLTYEQYEDYQNRQDEITGIIDNMGTDAL